MDEKVKMQFNSYSSQVTVPGGVFMRKHEDPEAGSAIWGGMLHICASRSVLLDTESTVSLRMISEVADGWADIVSLGEVCYTGREKGRLE